MTGPPDQPDRCPARTPTLAPMADPSLASPWSASTLPAGNPLVTAVEIDGELVVYDPRRREAHLLNPTAALLFDHCDGITEAAGLTAELAEAFAVDPATVTRDIDSAISQFDRLGLTERSMAPGDDPASTDDRLSFEAPPAEHWTWTSPVLRVLEGRARIRTDHPSAEAYVTTIFGSLAVGQPDRLEGVETFDVLSDSTPMRLLHRDRVIATGDDLDALLTFLHWRLNQLAIDSATDHVLLHASAIRRADGVVVFPAESNSGKSTLVAGLVRAGFGYVTDEAVAIALGDGRVDPYPKPISLDPGSWSLFVGQRPDVPGTDDDYFRTEWHLDPRRLSASALDDLDSDQQVTVVAFPRYVEGATTTAVPLRPADALLALLRNAFNLSTVAPAGVHRLAAIASEATVVELTVGNLDDAIDLIRTLGGVSPS